MVDSRLMRKLLLHVALVALIVVVPPLTGVEGLSAQAPSRGASGSASGAGFTVPLVYNTLANGLRVVISETHAAPVVVVEVMYQIGFRIEPRDRTGFAHLFEHMMFQGSENVGKFEHVRIVNENGGTLNGSTRFDHTN